MIQITITFQLEPTAASGHQDVAIPVTNVTPSSVAKTAPPPCLERSQIEGMDGRIDQMRVVSVDAPTREQIQVLFGQSSLPVQP